MTFKKGHIPWNKNKKIKTKENKGRFVKGDPRVIFYNKQRKGHPPWNKNKKGLQKAWNIGLRGEEYLKHFKNMSSFSNRKEKKLSDAQKKERNQKMRKFWLEEEYRKNLSKGVRKALAERGPEINKKRSQSLKRSCEEGRNSGVFKEGHVPWSKDPNFKYKEEIKYKLKLHRSTIIIPSKDTIPEKIIQNLLKQNNIHFQTHKSITGQPDIFIEPNFCIFVDGCYWHGCPECFDRNNIDSIQRKGIARDQFVTQNLINQGYKVLRLWEHEIKNNIQDCTENILRSIPSPVSV